MSINNFVAGEVLDATRLNELVTGIRQSVAVGTIMSRAADSDPEGYLYCNGQAVSRTEYSELFAEVGITYGAGDGLTTFNLPDFRGYFPRGFDDGRGLDTGRVFGSEQDDELGSHDHNIQGYAVLRTYSYGNPDPVASFNYSGTLKTGA